jgi:flagellar motor switch protein FliG
VNKDVRANVRLRGPEKAAVFLLSMGEDFTSQVLKELSENEVRELGQVMSNMREVSSETVDGVMREFQRRMSSVTAQGDRLLKNALSKVMGEKRANDILSELESGEKSKYFEKIRNVQPDVLVSLLKNEHPQTTALVLSHLGQVQAAQVIAGLPEDLKAEVVLRIAETDAVPPGVLREVDRILQEQIATLGTFERENLGGAQAVANILNRVDRATEDTILTKIEEVNPDLAIEIRRLMFVFEDLIGVDDKGMQVILQAIRKEELVLALKTASDPMKQKIFSNMSERAAEMIKEDLEIMGPVRLKDVEAAQQGIAETAKQLEQQGKLVIAGKGEETEFV